VNEIAKQASASYRGLFTSSHGAGFVPMVGAEQQLVNFMFDHLVPVLDSNSDAGCVIVGQEECAAKIAEWLRSQGVDLG
jgi:hypothetical protein